MTGPRIRVRPHTWWVNRGRWWASCSLCGSVAVRRPTAAAAADVGREHLRKRHGWMPAAEALALHRALAPLAPRVTVDVPGYSRACGVHTARCGAIECRCVSVDVEPCCDTRNPLQAAHNEGVRR